MVERKPRLAVLGLGTMGRGMAGSALRSGIPTMVWNRDLKRAKQIAAAGAEVAPTPTEAVKGVDMVITMLTDTEAVTSVALELGMLEALPAGAVWAQMSTIGVEGTETVGPRWSRERPMSFSSTLRCRGARSPPNGGSLSSTPRVPSRLGPPPNPFSTRSANVRSGSARSERVRV